MCTRAVASIEAVQPRTQAPLLQSRLPCPHGCTPLELLGREMVVPGPAAPDVGALRAAESGRSLPTAGLPTSLPEPGVHWLPVHWAGAPASPIPLHSPRTPPSSPGGPSPSPRALWGPLAVALSPLGNFIWSSGSTLPMGSGSSVLACQLSSPTLSGGAEQVPVREWDYRLEHWEVRYVPQAPFQPPRRRSQREPRRRPRDGD